MSRTFVVSDTHRTLTGGDSPWHYRHDDNPHASYGNYFAHYRRKYVDRWNSIVGPHDTVIHLGDVIWDDRKLGIFNHLNGKKILVAGNHDPSYVIGMPDGTTRTPSLQEVYGQYFTIAGNYYTYKDLILSHEPICPDIEKFALPKYANLDVSCYIGNIHGHFHNEGFTQEFLLDGNTPYYYETETPLVHYGVSCTPMNIEIIRAHIREQYLLNTLIPVKIFYENGLFTRDFSYSRAV